ncbi:NUDIX hydrolase [Alkalihalobacterium elongatum]|uniref:NUDIX hydrolase n=1 Tax=Alkalihalobacterium elongatum TaxID=2675466 RepID=UPI001C1FD604|nr:NUDIX hydrolase [Alkalihalobacterium elongatum]
MSQNEKVLAVSVTIFRDDEVLLIKENKPTAVGKWNFPGGRIENGEDALDAARREVKEETGFEVNLTASTGVYYFISATNHQVCLVHFTGEITGGSLELEEDEITGSQWIKVNDLGNFHEEALREPKVIKQIAHNLLQKELHPITIFNQQLMNFK